MTLTVPSQFEGFVRDIMQSGTYTNEEDVAGAALALLREEERNQSRLRNAIEAGWQQLEAGQTSSLEDVLARHEQHKQQWDVRHARSA